MKKKFTETIDNIPVKLSDLTLHPENPRSDYNRNDIVVLKESLNRSGQLNPIIIDEYGQILSGNRRYLASKELGWEYLKANIKVGLDEFSKRAILVSSNLTQVSINAWEHRDLIGKTYWDYFLETYTPTSITDKGETAFASAMGLRKSHARKIITLYLEKESEWLKLLRQNNMSSSIADTIVALPKNRRLPITQELVEIKNAKLNISKDELRRKARELNRNFCLDKKEEYPSHMFSKLKARITYMKNHLILEHIEKMSDKQKQSLKEGIEENILVYYKKLSE